MPKPFRKQSQEMVISYFERERDNAGPMLPLTAVRERVANALQISIASVSAVSQKRASNVLLKSPKKTRPRRKPICDLSENHEMEIRNVIYNMVKNKQHITKLSLLRVLKTKHLFEGGASSLGKVLKGLGFRFSTDNPRRGLMELPRIALLRTQFLQEYIKNLNATLPAQFVFLGETWIFQNGTTGRSWQDTNAKSVRRTKVDGKRHIVLHAGSKEGFIPGAALIFSSKTKTSDYHGEMNEDNFLSWFEEQLLKRLEEPSIIVMDNASYHSTLVAKTPNASWRKDQIKSWLQERNIAFNNESLKVQLLEIVSRNKPPKQYKADELALRYGHKVLRLPPYHCLFNPIEHIWGITKSYFNKHIGRDGNSTQNVLAMWEEALNRITPTTWAKTVRHTETVVRDWFERERLFDRDEVAPLIIPLHEDSDSDFEEYDSEDALET